jgi:hypothetical protein
MGQRHIYDQSGGVLSTVQHDGDNIIFQQQSDMTNILKDNADARSMGRLGAVESEFEPVARYHEAMMSHWLQEAGISRRAFAAWPNEERLKWITNKVQERDYRKFMRRDVKGLYV